MHCMGDEKRERKTSHLVCTYIIFICIHILYMYKVQCIEFIIGGYIIEFREFKLI